MTAFACFLTRCSAGIRIAINNAMIAITTNSSIKVNPLRLIIIVPPFFYFTFSNRFLVRQKSSQTFIKYTYRPIIRLKKVFHPVCASVSYCCDSFIKEQSASVFELSYEVYSHNFITVLSFMAFSGLRLTLLLSNLVTVV